LPGTHSEGPVVQPFTSGYSQSRAFLIYRYPRNGITTVSRCKILLLFSQYGNIVRYLLFRRILHNRLHLVYLLVTHTVARSAVRHITGGV
jgi:hypothetical protein